jgi:hypothetical protein
MRTYGLYLFSAALLLLLSVGSVAAARDPYSPPANQSTDQSANLWGGEHIEIDFTNDGGNVEFDCATGTISKPLAVDAHGKFRASGTFTRERPGPTLRDGNPALTATYSGSIAGAIMHLHIVAGAKKEITGDYVLVRGQPGHVMKCK